MASPGNTLNFISYWSAQLLSFLCSSDGKESACNAGDQGSIPGVGRSLEKEMATHSSILAWRIPWTRGQWATVHGGGKESRQDLAAKQHNRKILIDV